MEIARRGIKISSRRSEPDAEREHSIVLLRDGVVEGRLTLEEFSDRVGRAQGARTAPTDIGYRLAPSRDLDAAGRDLDVVLT
jgi:Domain of unknown function (DUF1707)